MSVNQVKVQQSIQFPQAVNASPTTSESVTALLNALFPEQQQQEKEVRQLKAILGELASQYTPDELHTLICEVRFLVENWLDAFEKQILEGKTLKELLNEGLL